MDLQAYQDYLTKNFADRSLNVGTARFVIMETSGEILRYLRVETKDSDTERKREVLSNILVDFLIILTEIKISIVDVDVDSSTSTSTIDGWHLARELYTSVDIFLTWECVSNASKLYRAIANVALYWNIDISECIG